MTGDDREQYDIILEAIESLRRRRNLPKFRRAAPGREHWTPEGFLGHNLVSTTTINRPPTSLSRFPRFTLEKKGCFMRNERAVSCSRL